jgi:glyoxylase-like metal-dependent hydrolase (beta-lactamase superfamily II)
VNLEHENALGLEDGVIKIPVLVGVIHHEKFGAHLIDAGLDASYVDSQYGTIRGLRVKSFLGKGSQEPGQHIAAILDRENIQIQTVWLTHLHPDHTAGIVDLPKEVPYVAGKGERYINFRFIIQTEHLAGIDQLYEIDLSDGIDLPPFGKSTDIFGDGSFWAIDSSGHSKGHILFFINGVDEQILFTGDAINIGLQFEKSIGSGTYSSDLEKSQEVVEQIIAFKELYPEVKLVFGHDLETF